MLVHVCFPSPDFHCFSFALVKSLLVYTDVRRQYRPVCLLVALYTGLKVYPIVPTRNISFLTDPAPKITNAAPFHLRVVKSGWLHILEVKRSTFADHFCIVCRKRMF